MTDNEAKELVKEIALEQLQLLQGELRENVDRYDFVQIYNGEMVRLMDVLRYYVSSADPKCEHGQCNKA